MPHEVGHPELRNPFAPDGQPAPCHGILDVPRYEEGHHRKAQDENADNRVAGVPAHRADSKEEERQDEDRPLGKDDHRVESNLLLLLLPSQDSQGQADHEVADKDDPHGQGQSSRFARDQIDNLGDHVDPGHHDLEPEQDCRGHGSLPVYVELCTT